MRLCEFPECGFGHYAKGHCAGHYQQHVKGQELRPLAGRRQAQPCSVDDCVSPERQKGLCAAHYYQRARGEEFHPPRPRNPPVCRFESCEVKPTAKGYCGGHYLQLKSGRELRPLLTAPRRNALGEQRCTGCQEWRPEDEFYKSASACKRCIADRQLFATFGITLDQHEKMLAAQGGGCKFCGAPPQAGGPRFPVDHDHSCCPGSNSCGKCIRWILCQGCNKGIGFMADDPDRLRAAADALEAWHGSHPAV